MIKPQSFQKNRRIRTTREYRKVQQISSSKAGGKKNNTYFTLLYAQGKTRIGITVSTKVGNSPQRNYIKRCVREFFRLHKNLFMGIDVVLIARPEMNKLNYHQIEIELINSINKK